EMLGELGCIDEELLRHAAADDACAAEAVFLGNGHALAERGRDARGARSARPAADDEEIIVVSGHGSVSAGTGAVLNAGPFQPFVYTIPDAKPLRPFAGIALVSLRNSGRKNRCALFAGIA